MHIKQQWQIEMCAVKTLPSSLQSESPENLSQLYILCLQHIKKVSRGWKRISCIIRYTCGEAFDDFIQNLTILLNAIPIVPNRS